MAKYDPLKDYLRRQRAADLKMSFVEIERKLGYMLPKGANLPQWWEGPPSDDGRHVQRRAWADAGYQAFLNVGQDSVTFRRIASAEPGVRA